MTPLDAWRFTLLGYPAAFEKPHWLALSLIAVLLGAWTLYGALRRKQRVEQLLSERLAHRLTVGVSVWRPATQAVMTGLGLVLMAVALAQPQCGGQSELTKKRGIDVVVALDASKSMLARDVQPSRIERAKLELGTLLDQLKGDRVGIVAFAGDAFIQSPLTSDYSAAKLFLRAVDPLQMPQGGTNIGAALSLSQRVLDGADNGAKERLIVLLSDGEDLTGDMDASIAALSEAGIRILSVGIGSTSGEPIPRLDRNGAFVDWVKDAEGQTVITRLDEKGLSRIAKETGGRYFHQARGVAMKEVLAQIDSLQKSELESRFAVKYVERYQVFAFPGLLLLLAAMLLRTSASLKAHRAAVLLLAFALFSPGSAQAMGLLEGNPPIVEEGLSLYREGRYAESLEAFDKAIDQFPNRPELAYDRALALAKVGRNDEAKAAFQQLLESGPPSLRGPAAFNLGNLHAQASERKEAISAYRKALRHDPQDLDARHNLEMLLRNAPPPEPPPQDGGAPDAGDQGQDGGTDAGQDGGVSADAGSPEDGGSRDGGEGDGGSDSDGGSPDGGTDGGVDGGGESGDGDGGADGGSDGGSEGNPDDSPDGGESDSESSSDGGTDGGSAAAEEEQADGGMAEADPQSADAGVRPEDLDKLEAERLLDAMKQNEKNLQLWRFQQKKRNRDPDAKDW